MGQGVGVEPVRDDLFEVINMLLCIVCVFCIQGKSILKKYVKQITRVKID
jgi:ACR3 family arsenite efflux pump ArsB